MNALFLIEAGPKSGLGHFRRMQVLANAMRKLNWNCKFGVNHTSIFQEAEQDGFKTELWEGNGLNLGPTDVLIIDGYHYDKSLLELWKRQAKVSVIIDDTATQPVDVDILINHNIYGDKLDYSQYKTRQQLTGPRYSFVNQRFLYSPSNKSNNSSHVLVSFGATDNGRYSEAVVLGILENNLQVIVEVVISKFFNEKDIFLDIKDQYKDRLIIHSGADMPDLMGRCSVFIGAAGVSVIEALAAKKQSVICAISDNHYYNISFLKEIGVSAFSEYNPNNIVKAALKILRNENNIELDVVDGLGAKRAAESITKYFQEATNGW